MRHFARSEKMPTQTPRARSEPELVGVSGSATRLPEPWHCSPQALGIARAGDWREDRGVEGMTMTRERMWYMSGKRMNWPVAPLEQVWDSVLYVWRIATSCV